MNNALAWLLGDSFEHSEIQLARQAKWNPEFALMLKYDVTLKDERFHGREYGPTLEACAQDAIKSIRRETETNLDEAEAKVSKAREVMAALPREAEPAAP